LQQIFSSNLGSSVYLLSMVTKDTRDLYKADAAKWMEYRMHHYAHVKEGMSNVTAKIYLYGTTYEVSDHTVVTLKLRHSGIEEILQLDKKIRTVEQLEAKAALCAYPSPFSVSVVFTRRYPFKGSCEHHMYSA
jgi:hypothetical protein